MTENAASDKTSPSAMHATRDISAAGSTSKVSPDDPLPAGAAAGKVPSPVMPSAAEVPPASTAGVPSAGGDEVTTPRKVKKKRPTQRACDENDARGRVCCGHLKRWYDYPPEIEALIGKKVEIYRCEFCRTLYTPDLAEMPHSYTLRY